MARAKKDGVNINYSIRRDVKEKDKSLLNAFLTFVALQLVVILTF